VNIVSVCVTIRRSRLAVHFTHVKSILNNFMFLLHSNHYDVVIRTGDLIKLHCANIAEGLGLHQIIDQPTRCNRILDAFYTNRPELFCTTVARSLVHSDHLSL
jgi:hypothetical protein